MSNNADFLIENGVLLKYNGKEKCVDIPEGVTEIAEKAFANKKSIGTIKLPDGLIKIGDKAFSGCSRLTSVVIPDSVESIGQQAFYDCFRLESVVIHNIIPSLQKSTFDYCSKLKKIILTTSALRNGEPISTNLISYYQLEKQEDIVYIYLYQHSKPWDKWLNGKKLDCNSTIDSLTVALRDSSQLDKKMCDRVVMLLNNCAGTLTTAHVEQLYDAVKGDAQRLNDLKKAIESANLFIIGTDAEMSVLDKYVIEALSCVDIEIEAITIANGISLKDKSGICSVLAIRLLVSEWVSVWKKERVLESGEMNDFYTVKPKENLSSSEIADKIAARLDTGELVALLESLVNGTNYRPYTIAFAKYADEAAIQRCVNLINTKKRGHAKERYWAENMENSLYYSETKCAYEYIEKHGNLSLYAKQRGTTIQELRDRENLPSFGFDENGEKKYIVAGKTIVAKITPELECALYDEDGNAIRSISKKTSEGERASADYAQLKKEVKTFIKQRTEYMKKIYITAEKISSSLWNDIYTKHPILKKLNESVLWDDGEYVLEMINGKLFDVEGNEHTPKDAVCIAHALDMKAEEISKWQSKLIEKGKKLLVEQVWEPIASASAGENLEKRYDKTTISKAERDELKRALKAKAIESKSYPDESDFDGRQGKYVFSSTGTMAIGSDITLRYEYNEDDATTTLGRLKMGTKSINREKNAIIFELDRACIKGAIRFGKDTALTDAILSKFTLSQINELIAFATECQSTSCTALLLDYKNRNFTGVSFLDSFVL